MIEFVSDKPTIQNVTEWKAKRKSKPHALSLSLSQFYSQQGENEISCRSFKKSSTTHCLLLHGQFQQFQQTIILGSVHPLHTVPLTWTVKDVSRVQSASKEQLSGGRLVLSSSHDFGINTAVYRSEKRMSSKKKAIFQLEVVMIKHSHLYIL